MKPIYLQENNTSRRFLYLQLYDTIKARILQGEMVCGEKLPSLRSAAADLGISITTAELAYNQLLVEGYIVSKPKAGYFVAQIAPLAMSAAGGDARNMPGRPVPDGMGTQGDKHAIHVEAGNAVMRSQGKAEAGQTDSAEVRSNRRGVRTAPDGTAAGASTAGPGGMKAESAAAYDIRDFTAKSSPYRTDPGCFDFVKWKKSAARVFNEYSELLLYESDPQGEAALRFEISKYLYHSRGVTTSPERIVIGAGTQQITGHLCRILRKMDIRLVALGRRVICRYKACFEMGDLRFRTFRSPKTASKSTSCRPIFRQQFTSVRRISSRRAR